MHVIQWSPYEKLNHSSLWLSTCFNPQSIVVFHQKSIGTIVNVSSVVGTHRFQILILLLVIQIYECVWTHYNMSADGYRVNSPVASAHYCSSSKLTIMSANSLNNMRLVFVPHWLCGELGSFALPIAVWVSAEFREDFAQARGTKEVTDLCEMLK